MVRIFVALFLDALRSGDFFVTTGEVLIPEFAIGGVSGGQTLGASQSTHHIETSLQWTFPLAYAEAICGDGERIYRQRYDLSQTRAFGQDGFRFPVQLEGKTWVRFEVWDVASNGAFTQPVWVASE